MNMTIAEAIKRIKNHMEVHRIGKFQHIYIFEALTMAIDALREKAEREDPKPLTLEELRQTVGTPVYIVRSSSPFGEWEIFTNWFDDGFSCEDETFYFTKSYGTRWKAYRHKPKEVQ